MQLFSKWKGVSPGHGWKNLTAFGKKKLQP
jgi:hypothetical protein